MGWSPRCYIPSFVEIGLSVPEKKIFDWFLPYRGVAAILVMSSFHQIFISLYLKAFIQSLVQIGTVVSEKIQFKFLYIHNLGPRSRYDLDLQYSHIFIYSIRCLLLLTFRSMTATVSEKSSFHFFLQKSLSYQIWPCRKIGQGHSRVIIWTNYDGLESLMLHTKFRENLPAGSGEENFWRVFTIYGHGGHLGHVTQMQQTNFCSPYPRRLHIKFGFDWPSSFGEEDLWALWPDGHQTMSIL